MVVVKRCVIVKEKDPLNGVDGECTKRRKVESFNPNVGLGFISSRKSNGIEGFAMRRPFGFLKRRRCIGVLFNSLLEDVSYQRSPRACGN